MGTPGACSPASGSNLGKKPQLLPPRTPPPGSEPEAHPGRGAGTSASLLVGETLWSLLFKAQVPRPGLLTALATKSQTTREPGKRVKLSLCWALRTVPLGNSQSPHYVFMTLTPASETLLWIRWKVSERSRMAGPTAEWSSLALSRGRSCYLAVGSCHQPFCFLREARNLDFNVKSPDLGKIGRARHIHKQRQPVGHQLAVLPR